MLLDFLQKYVKLSNILILGGVFALSATYIPVLYSEAGFYIKSMYQKYQNPVQPLSDSFTRDTESSADLDNSLISKPKVLDLTSSPVNKDFSILIEKIGVNAPIVRDVNVILPDVYMEALKQGVAHASFSDYPSDDFTSNVYLFAHSSNNFWELGRYSSVFNLIYKLSLQDEINVFFEGKRYVYQVDNKILVNDFKVDDTIYETFGPTLTLQTCYPTGTTQYRLVIRSTLKGIF